MADSAERRRLAYEAALLYYLEQQTMESIAKKMGLSRSTVSRLVASARNEGLVRISLHAPQEPTGTLASQLGDMYNVKVTIVPTPQATTELRRLEKVASVAGAMISEALEDGMTLGIAWGTTVSAISERLVPKSLERVTIVQLNGAANPVTTGIPYVGELLGNFGRAFGAKILAFPVPAFFDYASTRAAMWRERSIAAVRDAGRGADIAVFGVGAFSAPVASHVYAGGYMSGEEVLRLRRDGVVGDVCTVLVRGNGSYADIEINSRASGPTPAELGRIPRRICVAAGPAKATALAGVLRSGAVTDLIVDDECARRVVEENERRWHARSGHAGIAE
ncbi:MAG: transcriptional regulator [Actinomycetaceae bacterium]|jgi:DNA-binding transcriptional regulator LsrR (DeoR family)|nr:transcriptional regulator [Actinomycetaceae bacterium]